MCHVQIRCGDLYAGKVVEDFNACAITKNNCVAARVDVNKYPAPDPDTLVSSFDINDFTVSSMSQPVHMHNRCPYIQGGCAG